LSKNSFVLRALKILGLEDILKLSEILKKHKGPLERVSSVKSTEPSDSPHRSPASYQEDVSNLLTFPGKVQAKEETLQEDENKPLLSPESELFLLQIELSKHHEGTVQRLDALKEYKKTSESYQVQITSDDGKSVRKMISTNGILINKKQA